MEQDLYSRIKDIIALTNAAITTNTTTVGEIIDTLGFESLVFVILAGTITDGTYDFLLEESDDSGMSGATAVPSDDLLGSLTGFVAADDDETKRVGSVGKMRYQRLSIVSAATTTGVDAMSASAILGHPKTAPVA